MWRKINFSFPLACCHGVGALKHGWEHASEFPLAKPKCCWFVFGLVHWVNSIIAVCKPGFVAQEIIETTQCSLDSVVLPTF